MKKYPSHLVISLDFELFWGMFDKYTLESYGPNVYGERTAIPRMLALFEKYGIHATWATVGMLMTRDWTELQASLPPPNERPEYTDPTMSAYHHLETVGIGDTEDVDPYHFGSTLVYQILATPHQEIGNHTFSHYYCIDGKENTPNIFSADLRAHERIAYSYGVTTRSIVFPRNQWSKSALAICREHGLKAYRGNERHFLYWARRDDKQNPIIRALRLIDAYFNISGHHTYRIPKAKPGAMLNIPASRFFRPYMPKLAWLEPRRLNRIKKSMTKAAKRGHVYHLWWHPHNFGLNQDENFKNLEIILEHFKYLEKRYGMRSASMEDIIELAETQ